MDRTRDHDLAARLFGARPEHTLALLRAVWPGAVGDELARRTEVVAYDRGVLRVKVSDLRWQRTLQRMRRPILGRLRGAAGQLAPSALGFVTGDVPQPAVPVALPGPGEPPKEAPELVRVAAQSIPDPEIRKPFLAVAARYLARFGPPQTGGGSTPAA